MSIARFERFFRRAASLDIDKGDLERYNDFIRRKTYDLLLRATANAKANGRDVIQPSDLPITKGLQESIHAYRRLEEEVELEPTLRQLTGLPDLDLAYDDDTRAELPHVAGGLSYALARSFKIVNPELKNPSYADWDAAFRLFDLLM
jgi:hypothetical protein